VIVKVHQSSGLVSPYFQLAATPASSVNAGSLELVNPTPRPVTVRLDPVDAITTNTLGSAYSLPNAGIHGSTSWLRLSRQMVTVPAQSSRSVPVWLAVPSAVTPGDYLSGVAVEALGQTQTAKVKNGLAIGEIDRYAIGVEVKLPGSRRPALKFTGASVAREPSGLAFLVAATNPGNVILKRVRGSVLVTRDGHPVASTVIEPGTFVSGTSISYPVRAPREQPAPGTSYRVRAVLRYHGGIARLDTNVVFGHAAAVTQQSYGGPKVPKPASPWRWALRALAVLAGLVALTLIGALIIRRRRRPLSRASGLKLLERALESPDARPVSVLLVTAEAKLVRRVAAAIHPRVRRADRICQLSSARLLVICPGTARPAATVLQQDLYEQLARDLRLADVPIEITRATALKATTARKLLGRVLASQGSLPEPGPSADREPASLSRR
jgi:hypothetical protein